MSKNFEELLKALQDANTEAGDSDTTLAKAGEEDGDKNPEDEGDDDAAIAAAAAAAATEAAKGSDGDKGGEGKPFGKSLIAKTEAGEEVEAIDATELVKSLMVRQDATDANLNKALETVLGVVQKQGELVKSLTAEVAKLAGTGRGRKTLLAITEKPSTDILAKGGQGQPEQLTRETLMAKGNAAFEATQITGRELTGLDVALRQGAIPDAEVVKKILNA